ncbi:MAG TPA: DUF3097 family protein [Acidimicrobiales bacterium]|jgi:hypothetical protein
MTPSARRDQRTPGDRRDRGILAGPIDGPERVRAAYPEVEGVPGLRVEHRGSRFGGTVLGWEAGAVLVLGRSGQQRSFVPVAGAFEVERRAVSLVRPRSKPASSPSRTASGSVAVPGSPARVARASRILVEGIHDAALVERVWGDDLRAEGVVVERLDGADHLADEVRRFAPAPGRRLGILLDHLVDGSKEVRIAAAVAHPEVLVTGHPFVDIWQAVKPARIGLAAWPVVPKGRPWKEGVCAALGADDPAELWRRILGSVRSYADLEPALVGAVEQLIDFVTEPATT